MDANEKKAFVKKTKDTSDRLLELQNKQMKFKEDLQNSKVSSKQDINSDTDKGSLPRTKKHDSQIDLSGVDSSNAEMRSVSMKTDLRKRKADIEHQLHTIREQEEKLQQSLGVRSSRKLDYSNMDISHASDEGFDFDRELARANRVGPGTDSDYRSLDRKSINRDDTHKSDMESSQMKESKTLKFKENQTIGSRQEGISNKLDTNLHLADKQSDIDIRISKKKDAGNDPLLNSKDAKEPERNHDNHVSTTKAIDDKALKSNDVQKIEPKKPEKKDDLDLDFFPDESKNKTDKKIDKKDATAKDSNVAVPVKEKPKIDSSKGKADNNDSDFWGESNNKDSNKPAEKTKSNVTDVANAKKDAKKDDKPLFGDDSKDVKDKKKDDSFDFVDKKDTKPKPLETAKPQVIQKPNEEKPKITDKPKDDKPLFGDDSKDVKDKKKDDSFDFVDKKDTKPKPLETAKPQVIQKPNEEKPKITEKAKDDIDLESLLGDAAKPAGKKPDEKKKPVVIDNDEF